MNFSRFQKPSRYIDSEFNVIRKSGPVDVSVAFAFPDAYEVGMSHLGLRILYDIVNNLPCASAERVYAPWSDVRDYMKKEGAPLCSLESKRPMSEFDIVGFSLQYELSYTTVLDMLDLGGIPVRTAQRLESAKPLPLVIAGGPSTVNPAPMAPFIDAFLIGDGEEAIPELLKAFRQWKTQGDGKKDSLLREISRIEGFYVPSVHTKSDRIRRRFVADLESMPFPEKPIVPYMPIVHDRVNIEVARGCTMGCRFCQAGVIYRPLRERSPEKVLQLAEAALKNTGYDDVTFTSLSTGDYSCLLPLVSEFNRRYSSSRIAVSLPSLRVASVNQDVLRQIRSVRKTGFTMAPEAATERLRAVINKDFTDADYESALTALFAEGWLTLKLYFMIGLPTEREEDIEAINEMAMRALRIAKRNSGKFVNINITVSPFIPKPHTPFQWYGQISLDEMHRKLGFLRKSINSKKFKYKGHNEQMSFLEAVFARGDERLAELIEQAWRSGCRLDGWSEFFDFSKWTDAMEKTGIDGAAYAQKTFEKDDPLPWDNIDVGVSKEFLHREYTKAIEAKFTPDCKKACSACGLKCEDADNIVGARHAVPLQPDAPARDIVNRNIRAKIRVRAEFSKTGMLRYLSHLELVTAISRAMRRAGVPLEFSKGFHPKPEMSFCPPLSVGVAGTREYFDMEVFAPFDVKFFTELINGTLPDGIRISNMDVIPAAWPSLGAFISKYEYVVAGTGALPEAPKIDKVIVAREDKEVDLSACIESARLLDGPDRQEILHLFESGAGWIYRLVLKDSENIKVRIGEITEALFGIKMEDLEVIRMRMYGQDKNRPDDWKEPL